MNQKQIIKQIKFCYDLYQEQWKECYDNKLYYVAEAYRVKMDAIAFLGEITNYKLPFSWEFEK